MNYLALLTAVVICLLAAVIGSIFTVSSIPTWYAALNKPSFNPPNWVFSPVWTILFILMGIAAYLVWEKGWERKEVKAALIMFGLQLIFNVGWSGLFFALHVPWIAYYEMIVLWLLILATVVMFWRISKTAAWLLIPYLLWVGFASFLNLGVALLN